LRRRNWSCALAAQMLPKKALEAVMVTEALATRLQVSASFLEAYRQDGGAIALRGSCRFSPLTDLNYLVWRDLM
jgi:hypothetical protein